MFREKKCRVGLNLEQFEDFFGKLEVHAYDGFNWEWSTFSCDCWFAFCSTTTRQSPPGIENVLLDLFAWKRRYLRLPHSSATPQRVVCRRRATAFCGGRATLARARPPARRHARRLTAAWRASWAAVLSRAVTGSCLLPSVRRNRPAFR